MSKRQISDSSSEEGRRKRQHIEPSSHPIPLPDMSTVTPWSSSEITSELPPLPKILDPEIELAVFSHAGFGQGPNYERYEWLGDAYLELIATALIFQTFRSTIAGRCSQIREQLIRNATLAEYFREYDMGKRARLPQDIAQLMQSKPTSKARYREMIKIQGDIFEAFVAGVVLSDPVDGLRTVTSWLKALWGRTIKDQIEKDEKLRNSKAQDREAAQSTSVKGDALPRERLPKEQLAVVLVVKGIRLRYEDLPNHSKKDRNLGLPLYTIGVYLDGWGEVNKLLGVGTALNKKEAGQKAATVALENKKLMRLFGDKKKAFVEAQQKAQEGPEGAEKEEGG
ncbi:ribonuclease III domain-containing protein [Mariannaea sp. PMI_226]|nr:ribonuclease III domain-containing protein [Mariannaea sp. PMI_226]